MVKKNYMLNILYEIVLIITPLITTPYVSRVLGAEGIGQCAYYAAYASYFIVFAQLGIPSYGRRAIAKAGEDLSLRSKIFVEIMHIQLRISFVVFMLYCLFVVCVLGSNRYAWIYSIQVGAYIMDVNWLFVGMERFNITVGRSILIKILTIISIFTLVHSQNDLLLYAIITVSSIFLSNLLLIPLIKGNIVFPVEEKLECNQHIKRIFILLIPSLAVEVYKMMDKSMLGIMTTMGEVGMYESSEKLLKLPLAFVSALGAVMIPRISNLVGKKDEKQSKAYFRKSIMIVMFLSTSMSFGIIGVADVFVPWFFGYGFEKCIILLTILLPSCVFLAFANVIRTQFLLPHDMDIQLSLSLIIGCMVNLVLNFFLIGRTGAIGAAIATLITEITVAFFQSFFIRKQLPIKKYLLLALPFVWSGIGMCVFIRNIKITLSSTIVCLLIKVGIGGITYLGILLLSTWLFVRSLFEEMKDYCKVFIKSYCKGR